MKNERSVQDLIDEQVNCDTCFLVPRYQRGYRWQRVNVLDLLNDLCEFIDSDKDVYSLQPLVVYSSDDNTYHVVDGQQRLTTISIMLGFLGLRQIDIKYESRKEQQNRFVECSKDIDQYHVNRAYEVIKEWFENHSDKKDSFCRLLTDRLDKKVKFIWYCTPDNEVATFIRLNKDKISLTNAELIKALLLKKGNFKGDSLLMQKSIASEWNRIENTFNDNAFWAFIRPVTDNRETRIDYLFEIIKDKNMLSFSPEEETGNDNYSTFRYFYSYFKKYRELAFERIWQQTERLYNIFMYWYNEIEMYHYIGFLVLYEVSLTDLIDKWTSPEMTVDGFKKFLKDKINEKIKEKECNNLSKQYKYNYESNTDKTACKPVLLLFNLQRIIIINRNLEKKEGIQIFNKFPFYLYKQENWNVEHIASNTDNDLTAVAQQKEWLKTFLLDQSIKEEHRKNIMDFVKKDKPEKSEFEKLRNALEKIQFEELDKEEHLNDSEKNRIWNFCLLDEHTNKSYGNSIFPVKRRIIIGKELGKKYVLDNNMEEKTVPNDVAFVPMCTKDVFVKAYTASATSQREWSKSDAKAYMNEMYECLKTDFDVKL